MPSVVDILSTGKDITANYAFFEALGLIRILKPPYLTTWLL